MASTSLSVEGNTRCVESPSDFMLSELTLKALEHHPFYDFHARQNRMP